MSGKRDKKKSSKKSSKSKRREKEVDDDEEQDGAPVVGNSDSDDDALSRDRNKRGKKGTKKDKKRDKKSSRKAEKGEDEQEEEEHEEDGSANANSAKNKNKDKDKSKKGDKKRTDDRKGSKKKSRGRKGTSDGADSDEDKAAALAAAEKKLGARVNLVKEAKETFAELQARRATNMQRCRLALSLSAILGGVCVVVGAGLYIAFGFVGRCTDPDLPFDCGSFECCPNACNSTDVVLGEGSVDECSLVIANPVEISGIVLLIVGWIAIVASLVCFVQVNRVAQMEIPASAFGTMLVVALVLILAAIVGFIVAGVATTGGATVTNTVSLPQGFLILALTTIWPGALLLIISLVGLHLTWKSQATLRRRKVLVLGLSGSGKSLVVSGLLTAAEKTSGRGASGTVQNFSGKPTSGFLTQSVTRSDGHSLEFTETGGIGLSQLLRFVVVVVVAAAAAAVAARLLRVWSMGVSAQRLVVVAARFTSWSVRSPLHHHPSSATLAQQKWNRRRYKCNCLCRRRLRQISIARGWVVA